MPRPTSLSNICLEEVPDIRRLEKIAATIREKILEVLTGLGEERRGHPGGSLSLVEILTVLYFSFLKIDPDNPDWEERDRFVLSKGHGCLALYVALALRGFFDPEWLFTFRKLDSRLQGHPDMRKTPGVDMSSGSLGNGIAAGVGMALAFRAQNRGNRVCVVTGDGELQEGVVWEAAMTAGKYQLERLLAIVDCNGWQGSGRIQEIMPLEPLIEKWRAFQWNVLQTDGHDVGQIVRQLEQVRRTTGRPTVILAHTIKGKGVPFMENDNSWHQRALWPEEGTVVSSSGGYGEIGSPLFSTRAAAGEALLSMAREGSDFALLTADTSVSMGIKSLQESYPERCLEVGIAEQNLFMVAAGMASTGKVVFVCTYSIFAGMRALEQLRSFIACPRLPVKILAGLCGLSAGIEGVSHLTTEEVGILRCIPQLTIINPSDARMTRQAIRAAAAFPGPVYIRLGRDPTPVLPETDSIFAIGRGQLRVEEGWQAVLLTTGLITVEVLEAAVELDRQGIKCTVAEFPTLKPLDRELVLTLARRAETLFTVEEHNLIGGLGTAVIETIGEGPNRKVEKIGIPDCFLESGTPEELRRKYGLSKQSIVRRVLAALHRSMELGPAQEEGGEHSIETPQR